MNEYYKKMGWTQEQVDQHIDMMTGIHNHQPVRVCLDIEAECPWELAALEQQPKKEGEQS